MQVGRRLGSRLFGLQFSSYRWKFDYFPKEIDVSTKGGESFIPNPLVVEPVGSGLPVGSIIFLHSFGDTAGDWEDFVEFVQQEIPQTRWILPTAPIRPITCRNDLFQNSWYDVNSMTEPHKNKFEGLDESYQLVRSLIKTELEKGIPAERIALVGFSQGAAVALYTAVQYNGPLAGVAAVSGFLPKEIPGKDVAKYKHNFVMLHGRSDPFVPFKRAVDTFMTLQSKYGMKGDFFAYDGHHAINDAKTYDLVQYIYNRFSKKNESPIEEIDEPQSPDTLQ